MKRLIWEVFSLVKVVAVKMEGTDGQSFPENLPNTSMDSETLTLQKEKRQALDMETP